LRLLLGVSARVFTSLDLPLSAAGGALTRTPTIIAFIVLLIVVVLAVVLIVLLVL
jgi:hypothetical protein